MIAALISAVLAAGTWAVVTTSNGPSRHPAAAPSPGPAAPSPTPVPTRSPAPKPARHPTPAPSASRRAASPPARTSPGLEETLLAGREGFGRATTGGAGGQTVHVTSSADSGPGTLRSAVAGETPAWIVFDRDMTIRITSPIYVGSNKTVDGRVHHVMLTGPGTFGLRLMGSRNVIIANMVLRDFGDVSKTAQNDPPDAIDVIAAHNVWINHCDLSMTGNKLIMIDKGSTGVTVSWNHFHNQEQTFQIGDMANAAVDAAQTVTVDHNYFDRTAYRNPVLSYGKAHVYNNYIVGWSVWGVSSMRLGQMYLEKNIFQSTGNTHASRVAPARDGCNDANTRCDERSGYLDAVGNMTEGGAVLQTNDPAAVFTPSRYYAYACSTATSALAAEIAAHAGPVG
jgi:pectate lyase